MYTLQFKYNSETEGTFYGNNKKNIEIQNNF